MGISALIPRGSALFIGIKMSWLADNRRRAAPCRSLGESRPRRREWKHLWQVRWLRTLSFQWVVSALYWHCAPREGGSNRAAWWWGSLRRWLSRERSRPAYGVRGRSTSTSRGCSVLDRRRTSHSWPLKLQQIIL